MGELTVGSYDVNAVNNDRTRKFRSQIRQGSFELVDCTRSSLEDFPATPDLRVCHTNASTSRQTRQIPVISCGSTFQAGSESTNW